MDGSNGVLADHYLGPTTVPPFVQRQVGAGAEQATAILVAPHVDADVLACFRERLVASDLPAGAELLQVARALLIRQLLAGGRAIALAGAAVLRRLRVVPFEVDHRVAVDPVHLTFGEHQVDVRLGTAVRRARRMDRPLVGMAIADLLRNKRPDQSDILGVVKFAGESDFKLAVRRSLGTLARVGGAPEPGSVVLSPIRHVPGIGGDQPFPVMQAIHKLAGPRNVGSMRRGLSSLSDFHLKSGNRHSVALLFLPEGRPSGFSRQAEKQLRRAFGEGSSVFPYLPQINFYVKSIIYPWSLIPMPAQCGQIAYARASREKFDYADVFRACGSEGPLSEQANKVVKASVGWMVLRVATLTGRGSEAPDDVKFVQQAEAFRSGSLPASEEVAFAALCQAQKAAERKERDQAWMATKLVEVEKRRSKTKADELFLILAKIPKRSEEQERQFQVLISRERSREAAEKDDLAAIQILKKADEAAAAAGEAKRRQRTKNLCDAGGLMIKAGFLKEGTGEFVEDAAVIYGLLIEAKQGLESQREIWREKGRLTFASEQPAKEAQAATPTADSTSPPQQPAGAPQEPVQRPSSPPPPPGPPDRTPPSQQAVTSAQLPSQAASGVPATQPPLRTASEAPSPSQTTYQPALSVTQSADTAGPSASVSSKPF